MPHYYFDIKNGHRLVDPSGQFCVDDAEAILKAEAIALKIGIDAPSGDVRRHIAVLNSYGDEVSRVPIASPHPVAGLQS